MLVDVVRYPCASPCKLVQLLHSLLVYRPVGRGPINRNILIRGVIIDL